MRGPPRGADARGRPISLFTLHVECEYCGVNFLITDRMILKSVKCFVVSRRSMEIPSDVFIGISSSYIALPFGVSHNAAFSLVQIIVV